MASSSLARIRANLNQNERGSVFANGDFRTRYACNDAACGSYYCPRCRHRCKRDTAKRWTTDFKVENGCFFLTALFDNQRYVTIKEDAEPIVAALLKTVKKLAKEHQVSIRAIPEIKFVVVNGEQRFYPHFHAIGQAPSEAKGVAFDRALRNAFGRNHAVLFKEVNEAAGGLANLAAYCNKGQTEWLVRDAKGREFYDKSLPIEDEVIAFFSRLLRGREVAYGSSFSVLRDIIERRKQSLRVLDEGSMRSRVTCSVSSASLQSGRYKQNRSIPLELTWAERHARAKRSLMAIKADLRVPVTIS